MYIAFLLLRLKSQASSNICVRSFPHIVGYYSLSCLIEQASIYVNLRTVIVTAAVYWGFGSRLHLSEDKLTSFLNLPAPGRCQSLYVVLGDFAETCVFAKQSQKPLY